MHAANLGRMIAAAALVASMMATTWSPASADGYLVPVLIDYDPEECPQAQHLAVSTYSAPPIADPTTEWSERTLDLAVAVHPSYVDREGADWHDDALALVAKASAVYQAEMNIRLEVVHVDELEADDINASLQTPGIAILESLADYYQAEHADLERDAAVLLFGKNVGFGLVGQALCIGGTLNPAEHGYMWLEARGGMDVWKPIHNTWLTDMPRNEMHAKILVHELGHLLGAQHPHANCAEGASAYDVAYPSSACTIMSPHLAVLTLEFSTASRLHMRGWAEYSGI